MHHALIVSVCAICNLGDEGPTLLHCAAALGMERGVSALLEAGVCPDTPDAQGCVALHWACANSHTRVVQALLVRPSPDPPNPLSRICSRKECKSSAAGGLVLPLAHQCCLTQSDCER